LDHLSGGSHPLTVRDVSEGKESARKKILIILDVMMPTMRGTLVNCVDMAVASGARRRVRSG
jgi:hypothetical protein